MASVLLVARRGTRLEIAAAVLPRARVLAARSLLLDYTRQFYILNFYRPQRSYGKVMFLHPFVILFTGGVSGGRPLGRPPPTK